MFNNVSMSNIESRPLPGRKWEYGFYVDVIGNLNDPAIRNALAGIKDVKKRLGKYKRMEGNVK